jgi:hypothetical protein
VKPNQSSSYGAQVFTGGPKLWREAATFLCSPSWGKTRVSTGVSQEEENGSIGRFLQK